jgi:hypothetical protein
MAEVAAEVKKVAKKGASSPGSRFAVDRRKEGSGSLVATGEG